MKLNGAIRARHCVRARDDRRLCGGRPRRAGGRETVIVFTLIAAVLAVASLVYLVFALVKPERF